MCRFMRVHTLFNIGLLGLSCYLVFNGFNYIKNNGLGHTFSDMLAGLSGALGVAMDHPVFGACCVAPCLISFALFMQAFGDNMVES